MSAIGKPERATQDRIIALFRDELDYRFLGDRSDHDNGNADEVLLRSWLRAQGYSELQIERALRGGP